MNENAQSLNAFQVEPYWMISKTIKFTP